jgi:hypothetical protein
MLLHEPFLYNQSTAIPKAAALKYVLLLLVWLMCMVAVTAAELPPCVKLKGSCWGFVQLQHKVSYGSNYSAPYTAMSAVSATRILCYYYWCSAILCTGGSAWHAHNTLLQHMLRHLLLCYLFSMLTTVQHVLLGTGKAVG